MTETNWIQTTETIANFKIDIAFLTQKKFYFGDDNNPEQLANYDNFTKELYIPFSDKDLLITTTILSNDIEELVKYYENVLALSKKYTKKLNHFYFWIRPIIKNVHNGNILIGFPWYDTLNEITHLFSELSKEKEGNIFSDRDQGWELVVDNYDRKIFIKESDPDENETHCSINLNRQELIKQLNQLLVDTETIVGKLTDYFGTDYWTKRI